MMGDDLFTVIQVRPKEQGGGENFESTMNIDQILKNLEKFEIKVTTRNQ